MIKPDELVFVFEGRSGSWHECAQRLYNTEPVFRQTLCECSDRLEPHFGCRLTAEFDGSDTAPPSDPHAAEMRLVTTNVCLGIAIFELWRSRGICPGAVIGMSNGEYLAAYAAGVLSLEDTLAVSLAVSKMVTRSRIAGAMLFISIPPEAFPELGRSCPARLDLVMDLSPSVIIAFCTIEVLATVRQFLGSRNIACESYPFDWPYHTPRMSRDRAGFERDVQGINPHAPMRPFYSTMSGQALTPDAAPGTSHWFDVAVQPTRFSSAVSNALRDGFRHFVTIGILPSLERSIRQGAQMLGRDAEVHGSISDQDRDPQVLERSYERLRSLGYGKERASSKDASNAGPLADLDEPAYFRNPYSLLSALREERPVWHAPKQKVWLILGHEEVAWGLKHYECFSSKSPDNLAVDPLLLSADPPQHSRMRQALAPLVAQFDSSRIADICRAWLSRFISGVKQCHSPFDVVADLANPLPRYVVAEMLGLAPAESRELESIWSPMSDIPNPEITDDTRDRLARILERIQSQECPGICSSLLRATGPARLAFEEIIGLIKLLHLAGTTTTNHLISSAVLFLLKRPDLASQVRKDPKLLAAFIEEILRMESPAMYVMRIVVKETMLAGEIIPEGANVRLYLGAANRDPSKFDAPDELKLDRKFRNHLAFGAGSHFCPGAAISRTVAKVVIEHWLAELSETRCLLPLDAIPYHALPYLRAIRELPVSIDP